MTSRADLQGEFYFLRKKHKEFGYINKTSIMTDKETLQKEIYEPVKALKDKFYQCKTMEDWNTCKEELKPLLAKIAEPLMTSDFATKYKQNLVDAIAKMWQYKEPYFKKQENKKQFQPKVTYLLQPELAEALVNFLKLKTIQLSMEMEAQKQILDKKDFD